MTYISPMIYFIIYIWCLIFALLEFPKNHFWISSMFSLISAGTVIAFFIESKKYQKEDISSKKRNLSNWTRSKKRMNPIS